MRRLADERGIALVMALGILIVLSITTASLLTYTSSNARTARYQNARVTAYSLAEAGVNEALAVLNLPSNNPMISTLLPLKTSPYGSGTATWSGTYDPTGIWRITSTGNVRNPSGAAAVAKTLRVNVPIKARLSEKRTTDAWNYIYAFGPNDGNPDTCEMTIRNSVNLVTPLYVEGDLCLGQIARMTEGTHETTLVVGGRLNLANANQNWVGTAGVPIDAAFIGNGCVLQGGTMHSPCSAADNVFVPPPGVAGTNPPAPISPPTAHWVDWYNAAAPGPKFGCVASMSSAPSTWPVFESLGSTTQNNSVSPAWNLTPTTAYDCWTAGGELGWNPTTKVLTVKGTVFIDGSAYITNGAVNSYSGMGTLYLSGTFFMSQQSKLCAVVLSNGSGCDTDATHWDTSTRALFVYANGNADNGLPVGDGVQLVSSFFQGGVYATNAVEIDTSSNIDGPIAASTIKLGQSVSTSFPTMDFLPTGAGEDVEYAQVLPPTGYDG